MTEQERLKRLTYIFDLIGDCADQFESYDDHDGCSFCGDEHCTMERPSCSTAKARRARRELDRLITPPLESLHTDRLRNPAERIYHEVWQKDNERHSFLNSGFTTLEWILCPQGVSHPSPVTHRDAQVATSVIQWLGTSCGRSFIERAERQIKEEQAIRSEMEGAANNRLDQETSDHIPRLDEWAKIIAARVAPVTHFDYVPLEKLLKLALYRAYDAGARRAENFVTGTA